jgi:hypothetical protein
MGCQPRPAFSEANMWNADFGVYRLPGDRANRFEPDRITVSNRIELVLKTTRQKTKSRISKSIAKPNAAFCYRSWIKPDKDHIYE